MSSAYQRSAFIVKARYFTRAGVVIDKINDPGIAGAKARRHALFAHLCQANQHPVGISTTF